MINVIKIILRSDYSTGPDACQEFGRQIQKTRRSEWRSTAIRFRHLYAAMPVLRGERRIASLCSAAGDGMLRPGAVAVTASAQQLPPQHLAQKIGPVRGQEVRTKGGQLAHLRLVVHCPCSAADALLAQLSEQIRRQVRFLGPKVVGADRLDLLGAVAGLSPGGSRQRSPGRPSSASARSS